MDEEELSGHSPGQYLLRSDGNLLVSYTQPYRSGNLDEERNVKYYVIDREGKVISGKIFEHRTAETLHDQIDGGFMVMASPFGRRPLIAMDRNDRIFWAWSEDFLVQVFDGEGNYERAFFYPYRKSSLDRNAVIDRYEQDRTRRMVRSADAPATWPALNSLTVDDESRLWVSTITDDEETYDWWVLDEYGGLLAAFTWPRERTIQAVKNGYLYARQTDEFDLVEIMRYQVWLGEAEVEG